MATNILDQAQIADAINRQKLGSQRTKNEMMRQGTQDPGAFAMNNQSQIQQAQQPSEFWGAGRKELTAGTDQSLLGALGGTKTNLGGQDFYYSPYDLSKASWGSQDADDLDLGGGKYSIMNNGSNLGTGYKSLADTIKDYQIKQYAPTATQQWQQAPLPSEAYKEIPNSYGFTSDGSWGSQKEADTNWLKNNNYRAGAPTTIRVPNPQGGEGDGYMNQETSTWEKLVNGFSAGGRGFYNSEAEAAAAQQGFAQEHITGNNTRDWETLGQLLNYGGVTGDWSSKNSLGGNKVADPITGLNTLFGSKPIIYDGKLLGYQGETDPGTIQKNWNEQTTEDKSNWYNKKTEHNWDVGQVGMGRSFTDPEWWKNNAMFTNNGKNFTITPDAASQSTGWKNADYYDRQAGSAMESKGVLQRVWEATSPTHLLLNQEFADMQPIGAAVGNYFIPGLGSALNALDSYSKGDSKGGQSHLVGAGLSYFGGQLGEAGTGGAPVETGISTAGQAANSMSGSAGGVFGSGVGLGSTAFNQAAQNALLSAGGAGALAGINGGNFKDSALAALVGGAGGIIGSGVTNATNSFGGGISNFLGGASTGALQAAIKNQPILSSALQSGVARGIGGLFNDVAGVKDKPTQQRNISTGQSLAKIFQTMRNKNGTSTTGR